MTVLTALSIRQLAGGKRMWLMLVLAAIPLLFAVIFALVETDATGLEFSNALTNPVIASTILPLVMLVLATSSFGNELDDHTLPYLVLKPIARWKIVASKLLASLLVGGVPVVLTGLAVDVDQRRRRRRPRRGHRSSAARRRDGLRGAFHVGGPGCALCATGLESPISSSGRRRSRHSSAARRFLSVRQYVLAVVHGIDDSRLRNVGVELSLAEGLIGAAAVVAVFAVLTTRRLERMDTP